MYVCVCNAITEGQIKRAIRNGAATLSQLRDELAVATCCGTCTDHVEHCLRDTLDDGVNRELPLPDLASI